MDEDGENLSFLCYFYFYLLTNYYIFTYELHTWIWGWRDIPTYLQ